MVSALQIWPTTTPLALLHHDRQRTRAETRLTILAHDCTGPAHIRAFALEPARTRNLSSYRPFRTQCPKSSPTVAFDVDRHPYNAAFHWLSFPKSRVQRRHDVSSLEPIRHTGGLDPANSQQRSSYDTTEPGLHRERANHSTCYPIRSGYDICKRTYVERVRRDANSLHSAIPPDNHH